MTRKAIKSSANTWIWFCLCQYPFLITGINSKELSEMQIGDVFIRGGSPGHCVIVVDMAVHQETGEKLFMLAQSYMPA